MANPLINSGDAVLVVYMQYGVERILTKSAICQLRKFILFWIGHYNFDVGLI